jgi:hypothetical protein
VRLVAGLSLALVAATAVAAAGTLAGTLTRPSSFRVAAVATLGLVAALVAAATLLGTRSVPLSTRYW